MGSFQLCIWHLGISLLPYIIIVVELVLRADLIGVGGLLVLTLLKEILIHCMSLIFLIDLKTINYALKIKT